MNAHVSVDKWRPTIDEVVQVVAYRQGKLTRLSKKDLAEDDQVLLQILFLIYFLVHLHVFR